MEVKPCIDGDQEQQKWNVSISIITTQKNQNPTT